MLLHFINSILSLAREVKQMWQGPSAFYYCVEPSDQKECAVTLKLIKVYHSISVAFDLAIFELFVAFGASIHDLGQLDNNLQHAILRRHVRKPLLKGWCRQVRVVCNDLELNLFSIMHHLLLESWFILCLLFHSVRMRCRGQFVVFEEVLLKVVNRAIRSEFIDFGGVEVKTGLDAS
jgi:hypothetical protein